jgi:(S)-citramalyl-CoA lyase
MDIALARCILFVPGHRPDRFAKALATGADAVVIDLEDAVPPAEKAAAREAVLARPAPPPGVALGVRINAVGSALGIADLAALLGGAPPDFVMLPKVESAAELRIVHRALGGASRLIPQIETAEGLAEAGAIAREGGCAALAFGGADLAADLGCALAWEPMLVHRAGLVAAAARGKVALFDVPFLSLDDEAALVEETRRAQSLGFTGKLAIHPKQVAPIQAVLTPPDEQVAWARRVIEAIEQAAGGVCVVDGKMIDAPVAQSARRVLARA